MQPNVCTDCGTDLEGRQAWVRSGRLLCSQCDFAHKSPSRWAIGKPRKPHTPKRKVPYWKPQVWRQASLTWVDVQTVCDTAADAYDIARAAVPKAGGHIRTMQVDPDGTRTPGPSILVPAR